jgi:hypothetical protein
MIVTVFRRSVSVPPIRTSGNRREDRFQPCGPSLGKEASPGAIIAAAPKTITTGDRDNQCNGQGLGALLFFCLRYRPGGREIAINKSNGMNPRV